MASGQQSEGGMFKTPNIDLDNIGYYFKLVSDIQDGHYDYSETRKPVYKQPRTFLIRMTLKYGEYEKRFTEI